MNKVVLRWKLPSNTDLQLLCASYHWFSIKVSICIGFLNYICFLLQLLFNLNTFMKFYLSISYNLKLFPLVYSTIIWISNQILLTFLYRKSSKSESSRIFLLLFIVLLKSNVKLKRGAESEIKLSKQHCNWIKFYKLISG